MKLYGKDVIPRCHYCEFGAPVKGTEHVNCLHRGVVTEGYSCRRFRYDPLKRIPARPASLPQFDAKDFSICD